MRKNHFLAAAGAMSLLLASCASDEPVASVNTSPENLITYSTGIANQSRALNSYCASIMPDGFNVWAYVGDNPEKIYISGDKITKTGDGYAAEVDRFWPEDGAALTFFAYVDAEGTFKYDGGEPKFENYTIKDNVSEQLDLMYAVAKDATSKETVQLNFRHALAQVCYKAVNTNPNLRITVNSITVAGLAGKGTYTFPTESTTANYENHAGTEPTGELNRGSWTLEDARSSSYEVKVGGVTLSDAPGNLTFPELDEEGVHAASDFSRVLALLPYDGEKTTAATVEANMTALPTDGTYFILNLTVENIAYNENGDEVTYPLLDKKDFYVGAEFDWAQGNRYTYTFKFDDTWTPDNLEPIAYDVTVDDYINQDGGTMENPTHWTEPFSIPKPVLMVEATDDQPAIYIADRNLGAPTSFDISDEAVNFGNYYAWGNLTGTTKTTKEDFEAMGWTEFSSNNWDQFMARYDIFDESGHLKPEYDAATNALGDGWHIPTKEEWERFLDGTTHKFSDYTTGSGRYVIFTSKTTGNTVSIPCPGYLGSGGYITRIGETGQYMSSTPKMPDVGTVTSAYGLHISTPNTSVTIGTVSVFAKPASIRPFYTAPAE